MSKGSALLIQKRMSRSKANAQDYVRNASPLTTISQFEMPTPKQYWEGITFRIADELKKFDVKILDCYLVGSGMKTPSLTDIEDIDSAMILAGNYPDNELLLIRDMLDNLILKIDKLNKYHFRLFDEVGFQSLATYDGYRLFEFQCENLSFCGTDVLFQSCPILNSDNFNLSYLTQLVYDALMTRDIFEFRVADIKAEDRKKRNCEINFIKGIELDSDGISSMLNEFVQLRNDSNMSIPEWQRFLEPYYLRMRHEFVNKSSRYQLNLEEYLCR